MLQPQKNLITVNIFEKKNSNMKGINNCNNYVDITINNLTFRMIYIQAGEFQMGASNNDLSAFGDEKPAHHVLISHDYYIGETPVTQDLWNGIMNNNPSHFVAGTNPVETVSWNDCQEFIIRLNDLSGKTFRLPTEAEWEFAARCCRSNSHQTTCKKDELGQSAWYEENADGTTHSVASKKPNELGIYDMLGNVWEWCSDRYGNYQSCAQMDPLGPSSGMFRVFRGGSWAKGAIHCTITSRSGWGESDKDNNIGLRLVMVP